MVTSVDCHFSGRFICVYKIRPITICGVKMQSGYSSSVCLINQPKMVLVAVAWLVGVWCTFLSLTLSHSRFVHLFTSSSENFRGRLLSRVAHNIIPLYWVPIFKKKNIERKTHKHTHPCGKLPLAITMRCIQETAYTLWVVCFVFLLFYICSSGL